MGTLRKSNFELLRILAILFVVVSHICATMTFDGGYYDTFHKINQSLVDLGHFSGQVGNFIFIFLFGYFSISKEKINLNKFINLFITTVVYSVLIFGVVYFTIKPEMGYKNIIKQFLPIMFENNWFITAYLMVYLLTPAFNKFMQLDRKLIKYTLIILLIPYTLIAFVMGRRYFYTNLAGFILIYLLAGYYKLYQEDFQFLHKKQIKLLLIILPIIFVFSMDLISHYCADNFSLLGKLQRRWIHLTSLPVMMIGMGLFLVFSDTNIKYLKIINYISRSTLGIYLIHFNMMIRTYVRPVLETRFLELFNGGGWYLFVLILCMSLILFIACLLIDLIFRNTIGILINMFSKRFSSYILKKWDLIFLE